ncbi:DUF4139 domain-containing protein [Marinihelvus fidelis]|uniref:DUF4139 domain-containing protein n=1 Tax=Marinihelvus fidelis TaxID=2613842 RepID=A0A5N0TET3_9GAMM|nr:DUF4139 domain-containing protein [Marinihelvus fidelis]KAA9132617.1 DUF4139 domain-containing protein [Marinihelvus fidelis]
MRTHRMTRRISPIAHGVAVALLAGFAAACHAQDPSGGSDDAVTIYSSLQPGAVSPELYRPVNGRSGYGHVPGYAIVRHDRSFEIGKGLQTHRVTDVAALIDPTTVTFASLDEPGTRVIEQSFKFDLVSQAKLIQRYLGETITVEVPRGDHVEQVSGVLLGATDGLTLQLEDGSVQAVRSYTNITFGKLPGGLMTRPTLEWLLDSPAAGEQTTRVSYETQGMTWWADYNIVYDETDDCSMDLSAWVSIVNQSGASYDNARLKLIAGDVNRAQPAHAPSTKAMRQMAMMEADAMAGFEEKSFFEYHLYTLGRRTDLPENSTRQLELMPSAEGVACEKELVFAPTLDYGWYGYQQLDQGYGRVAGKDVSVFLRFANDENSGLGVPLPAGRIRVNQLDTADGSLEFIGEDVLDHTPRNEDVLIRMGNAFDVVGERTQVDFRVDSVRRNLWETFEIKLRNHKDEAVNVAVLENLYRAANWDISDASHRDTKDNAHRVRFDVKVPAEGETVIRYTVHYDW